MDGLSESCRNKNPVAVELSRTMSLEGDVAPFRWALTPSCSTSLRMKLLKRSWTKVPGMLWDTLLSLQWWSPLCSINEVSYDLVDF